MVTTAHGRAGREGTDHVLRAELAATVIEVATRPGDRVAPSDVVVVVESMKMEIPVLAEVDGTVRTVAAVGAAVQADDVLATIRVDGAAGLP